MVQGLGARRFSLPVLSAVLLVVAIVAVLLMVRGEAAPRSRPVGLFTSLPLLWREASGIQDLLGSEAPPHWALAEIERQGRLRPLDTLAGKDGKLPLPPGALLVMAQPRPLSPAENVALDDWVRAGGQVLLFADPLLTAHSAFALGDRRRPQDVVLLSPILTRWGLNLLFDADQPPGMRDAALLGEAIPVDLPGRFELRSGSGCALLADGLAARCRIGRGVVLAVADATLFQDGKIGDAAARSAVLEALLREIDR